MNGGSSASLAPFTFPCFVLRLIGVETKGLLDYQGRAGIISIVRWNLRPVIFGVLSGPLNRLNAILSLLQPLDRYRTPSAIGSAIGRPLSRPISHPNTGGSPQPPCSKPLIGGSTARYSGAIVSKTS